MPMKPIAVVVAPTLNERVVTRLETHFDLHVVPSFEAAKAELIEQPDLLVTEIRLAAYNGLHLALRAQARGIRAIILAPPDRLFQRDAERFGAVYLDVAAVDEISEVAQRLVVEPARTPSASTTADVHLALIKIPDTRRIPLAV
jgi:hypothetical protein